MTPNFEIDELIPFSQAEGGCPGCGSNQMVSLPPYHIQAWCVDCGTLILHVEDGLAYKVPVSLKKH